MKSLSPQEFYLYCKKNNPIKYCFSIPDKDNDISLMNIVATYNDIKLSSDNRIGFTDNLNNILYFNGIESIYVSKTRSPDKERVIIICSMGLTDKNKTQYRMVLIKKRPLKLT